MLCHREHDDAGWNDDNDGHIDEDHGCDADGCAGCGRKNVHVLDDSAADDGADPANDGGSAW